MIQKFNGRLEMTEKLEGIIFEKFSSDPTLKVIPIYSASSELTKSSDDKIIGYIDRRFNLYRFLYSNSGVTFKSSRPIICLDSLFHTVDGKFNELVEIREALGMWSRDMVNETNKIVHIESTFIMATKEPIEMAIAINSIQELQYNKIESDDLIDVNIINISENPLPKYESSGAAGLDVMANIKEPIDLRPGKRVLIPAGIKVELPSNISMDVRPKSGLALKRGITVLNTPGLIDEDYRGEVGVILINHGEDGFVIKPGDKIAQITFSRVIKANWVEVSDLTETERGEGGFGSTSKSDVCNCGGSCGDKCSCK